MTAKESTVARCPKCGADDLWTSYHAPGCTRKHCSCSNCGAASNAQRHDEHLHRGCRVCHFDWTEDVRDAAPAEPNLPEGVLWALESEDFMAMVNEVSLAARGLPEHLSDAEREAKTCECGYPEKPCLRIMLRNGPPFPPRPCEPKAALRG